MSDFAERILGHRIAARPPRTIVVALLVLGAAAGLVALGRWTAPTASTSVGTTARTTAEGCGTIAPATMPSAGCQQLLTRMYLGAPEPCGTIAPQSMPSPACQRVLERVFLGTE